MKRSWSLAVLAGLMVGLAIFMTDGWTGQQQKEIKPYVLTPKEEQLMSKIGTVPYIVDVLFDETPDGKILVSAVAEIGTSQEADRKKLARDIIHLYSLASFQAGVEVAEASIHVTEDNRLIMGASLDRERQKKMTQSAATGAGAMEFIQFLKENETPIHEFGKNTWYYEVE